jgi:hypothetical protein
VDWHNTVDAGEYGSMMFLIGIVLLVFGTLISLLTIGIVGPVNTIYFLILSTIAVYSITKIGKPVVAAVVSVIFSLIQFITPVPICLCIDDGYYFCRGAYSTLEYNYGDVFLLVLFALSYALTGMGLRSRRNGRKEKNED